MSLKMRKGNVYVQVSKAKHLKRPKGGCSVLFKGGKTRSKATNTILPLSLSPQVSTTYTTSGAFTHGLLCGII